MADGLGLSEAERSGGRLAPGLRVVLGTAKEVLGTTKEGTAEVLGTNKELLGFPGLPL